MSKIQSIVVEWVSTYNATETSAQTATDIAATMPANHSIDFWVNAILKANEAGLINRTDCDEYFAKVAA